MTVSDALVTVVGIAVCAKVMWIAFEGSLLAAHYQRQRNEIAQEE